MGQSEIFQILSEHAVRNTDKEQWWMSTKEIHAEIVRKGMSCGIGHGSVVRALQRLRNFCGGLVESKKVVIRNGTNVQTHLFHRIKVFREERPSWAEETK